MENLGSCFVHLIEIHRILASRLVHAFTWPCACIFEGQDTAISVRLKAHFRSGAVRNATGAGRRATESIVFGEAASAKAQKQHDQGNRALDRAFRLVLIREQYT